MSSRPTFSFADLALENFAASPSDGDVASFDVVTGKWLNRSLATAGIAAASALAGKADKVGGAVADNVATLTADGGCQDSGLFFDTGTGFGAVGLLAFDSDGAAVGGGLGVGGKLSGAGVSGLVVKHLATAAQIQLGGALGTGPIILTPKAGYAVELQVAVTVDDAVHFALGTSGGTKFGDLDVGKLGFYNATPVARGTGNVLTALAALGLIGTPTLAESDIANLVNDLAAKAPLASPTFTGSVKAPLLDLGTDLGQKLYLYHSGNTRYGASVDSGVMNFFAGGAARVGFGAMSESDGVSFTEYFSAAGAAPFARYWGSPASGSVGTEQTVSLIRQTSAGVSWPQVVDFRVGRHTGPSASAEPFTRLDLAVKGAQDGSFTADVVALTLRSDLRNIGRAASSAPTDADIPTNGMTFYLDESGDKLKVRVCYSDGTLKTGEVSLT